MKKRVIEALVLQGGGPLGAFEYGVCKALYEKEGFDPEIVCGVSIGAMQAAIIVGCKNDSPIEALGEFWELCSTLENPFLSHEMNIKLNKYDNPGMYSLNYKMFLNPDNVPNQADLSRLRTTLNKLIDFNKINNTDQHLVVTATNIESGEIESFDNKSKNPITVDHIIASGSIPPFAPPIEILGNHYWDGALFSNTPLLPAYKKLRTFPGSDDEIIRELIIIELFPKRGTLPKTMAEVKNRMLQLQFEPKSDEELEYIRKVNENIDIMKEIDTLLPPDSKVRKMKAYKEQLKQNKVHKFTLIEHTEPEKIGAFIDWTKTTITKRIEEGYRDGLQHLNEI
jgi:NTE family protein